MSIARNYVDNAPTTTVSGAINNSATSFAVASLAGFPTNFPYTATLGLGTSSAEVILVTAATGSTVTVTRNYNGLGAFSHPDGETFNHTANAIDYSEANAHVNASSGVHGVTGSVVGTGGTQTLTNKTLTAPVISTISNTGTLTLPTSTDTLVGRATTDTLTNKTLTNPAINGGVLDAVSTIAGISGTALAADRAAWTTYTPTFTNLTGGAGVFAYKVIGKTLHIRGRFTAGTGVGGSIQVSLPAGYSCVNSDQCVYGQNQSGGHFGWSAPSGTGIIASQNGTSATVIGYTFSAVIEVA